MHVHFVSVGSLLDKQPGINRMVPSGDVSTEKAGPKMPGHFCVQVYLDPKDRNSTEWKVETFKGVYKKLTGKDVVFEFPVQEAA